MHVYSADLFLFFLRLSVPRLDVNSAYIQRNWKVQRKYSLHGLNWNQSGKWMRKTYQKFKLHYH